jgi:hypothetical protein
MDGIALALNIQAPLLMIFGAVLLYVASRAAVDAATRVDDPAPMAMAAGHWMPIVWVALFATALGHSEVGLGVAFSSSVVLLSLDLGVLGFMAASRQQEAEAAQAPQAAQMPQTIAAPLDAVAPPSEPSSAPPPAPASAPRVDPPSARFAPMATARAFVLPAALFTTMAGFRGALNWLHALMLLLLGGVVAAIWFGNARHRPARAAHGLSAPRRLLELFLGIVLGGVGAWVIYLGTIRAGRDLSGVTTGLLAVIILSPVLTLPVLGTGATAVQNGRLGRMFSTLAAMVLLNLCVLIPAVVLMMYARDSVLAWLAGQHHFHEIRAQLSAVPFPLAVWRVDSVLLVVLGLLLIPVSMGRLIIGRMEGVTLVVLYAIYLIMSAVAVGHG